MPLKKEVKPNRITINQMFVSTVKIDFDPISMKIKNNKTLSAISGKILNDDNRSGSKSILDGISFYLISVSHRISMSLLLALSLFLSLCLSSYIRVTHPISTR